MDRSWINLPRTSSRYMVGLNHFLDFAFNRSSVNNQILCPCPKCKFKKWHPRNVVLEHLIVKQFPSNYTFWGVHGENDDDGGEHVAATSQVGMQIDDRDDHVDPLNDVVRDAFGVQGDNIDTEEGVEGPLPEFFRNEAAKNFFDLMTEADKPLFPVKLYHIKCLCGFSDKGMSLVLELLGDAFSHAEIPTSFYEAKKTINKLGLSYTKIHACPNDCMLYWGDDAELERCKRCNASRYKQGRRGRWATKKPAKILRYFPLTPRL